jgi:hypothetical protein
MPASGRVALLPGGYRVGLACHGPAATLLGQHSKHDVPSLHTGLYCCCVRVCKVWQVRGVVQLVQLAGRHYNPLTAAPTRAPSLPEHCSSI